MMRTLFATMIVTLVSFAGCQTYDFEQVVPLAIAQTTQTTTVGERQLKPNMLLLVDKSGSMKTPIAPPAASCSTCGSTTNRALPAALPASVSCARRCRPS